MSKSKDAALKAKEKPAAIGPDIDVNGFTRDAKPWSCCPVASLPEDFAKRALTVGVRTDEGERAGTYFQVDHSTVFQKIQKMFEGKAEIMSTKDAFEKYDWMEDYWWKVVSADADKYTALAELEWDKGYFIRALEGQKITLPLQACLFISKDNLDQNVHNVIIAEPNSEVQIITGCTVHPNVRRGLHVGISEFFIKEGAKLTFTMIHNLAQNFDVRPRTGALVEDNATFITNYICLNPVKSLQMYPVAYCKGKNSRARFTSILYGSGDSYMDVGSKAVLQGTGSKAEMIARVIAIDRAKIYSRGLLVGEKDGTKAHLECRGLLLSDDALIHAIPELTAKVKGTELSHEAAVGKIAEEQIQYLMARGFSELEAQSLIVRGFMDVGIMGLPKALETEIKRMVDTTTAAAI
ncbi:MAG: SufD family Fe-S cluster assembly protein [Candidatus Hadarchaeum sp.]|nr:SufD family Fe-S cluster assembly protein [Candidatus Hadarchaeum sp.]